MTKVIKRDCTEVDFQKEKISNAILKAMKNGSGIVKPKIAEDIANEIYEECKGKEEILCQLSEECAELIQACLKYRRTMKGLTPKTETEAKKNLFEELADVLLNIQQVMYLFSDEKVEESIKSIQSYKTNRWWRRTFISQEEN